jgi:hypothetical protein
MWISMHPPLAKIISPAMPYLSPTSKTNHKMKTTISIKKTIQVRIKLKIKHNKIRQMRILMQKMSRLQRK